MQFLKKANTQVPLLVSLIFSLSLLSVEDIRVSNIKKEKEEKILAVKSIKTEDLKIDVVSISVTPLPTSTPTQTPTPTLSPTATPKPKVKVESKGLDHLFEKYSQEYDVDRNLLLKIAHCESGFNTESSNGPYLGMFQFTASSWVKIRREMGLSENPDLRTNVEESIKTAAYKISRYGTSSWPSCSK